jgi:hypothetical protein
MFRSADRVDDEPTRFLFVGDAEGTVAILDRVPWYLAILGCLTLGLAPFAPPHVWEKAMMLAEGRLVRAIDWFDLLFHGLPWIVLFLKGVAAMRRR